MVESQNSHGSGSLVTINGNENVIVILKDSHFNTKAQKGLFHKNKGLSESEVLRGKVTRKLGPTNVISLAESHQQGTTSCLFN